MVPGFCVPGGCPGRSAWRSARPGSAASLPSRTAGIAPRLRSKDIFVEPQLEAPSACLSAGWRGQAMTTIQPRSAGSMRWMVPRIAHVRTRRFSAIAFLTSSVSSPLTRARSDSNIAGPELGIDSAERSHDFDQVFRRSLLVQVLSPKPQRPYLSRSSRNRLLRLRQQRSFTSSPGITRQSPQAIN